MRLLFLGTGASGGTPGHGRSRRLESSVLISDGATLLIDVTRDFAVQAERLTSIDAVALTHAHRDAIGGLPALRCWWLANRAPEPIDVFLSEATANIIHTRYRRLEHCRLRVTAPGDIRRAGPFALSALTVPHAQDPRFPTYAWRVSAGAGSIVYASDVAHLTPELERFCSGRDRPRPRRRDVAPAIVLPSDDRRDAANRLLLAGRLDHPHPDRPQRPTSRPTSARGRRPLLEGPCGPRSSRGEDLNAGREGSYMPFGAPPAHRDQL